LIGIIICFVLGYHVLLEKPMEVSVEDCEAILAAQKTSGAKLMIAFRLHHEPGTLDVIDRVRKGDFGDPRIFTSVFTQDLKPDNHRAKYGKHSSILLISHRLT
jgi:predicted dehydrogenase